MKLDNLFYVVSEPPTARSRAIKSRFDRYDALLALVVLLSLDRDDETYVVKMTRSALPSLLGSEFDDFLFAPIGEEKNGMLLSVVSALARLDIDPWQETAQLAQLPGINATQRLASLIAALPDRPAHQDPRTIAAGLIALLPRRADPNVISRQKSLGVGEVTDPHSVKYTIFINVIFWAFVTAALGILAGNQAPAPVDTHVAASNQVVPPAPSLNSGR